MRATDGRDGSGEAVVRTATGRLRGRLLARPAHTIARFSGIPYAVAPIGEHRWRPPRPVESWPGLRDALEAGAVCPQGEPGVPNRVAQSEDCLSLNVWTPDVDGQLPVIVYLPGGGFVTGNASARVTDGTELASRGVVVVAVNYRLHAFGFLDLGGADDPNLGLLDVVAALEWLRENIAAFGGDCSRVTLAGYSAGANLAASVLASPRSRGLVHNIVLQDGGGLLNLSRQSTAMIGTNFCRLLGVPPNDRAALTSCSVVDVLKAAAEINRVWSNVLPTGEGVKPEHDRRKGLKWTPSIGPSMPQPVIDALRAGTAAGVPMLLGTCRDSMSAVALRTGSIDIETFVAYLGSLLDHRRSVEDVIEVYREERPGATLEEIYGLVMTDVLLAIPAVQSAEAQMVHSPVWLYEFGVGVEPTLHGADTGLWFGNVPMTSSDGSPAAELARALADMFADFAKTGAAGDAPFYDTDERPVMTLGHADGAPGVVTLDPHRGRRLLWQDAELP